MYTFIKKQLKFGSNNHIGCEDATREDVQHLYRKILGREVESENVILHQLNTCKNKYSLMQGLINSKEFENIHISKKNYFYADDIEGVLTNKHNTPLVFPSSDECQLRGMITTGGFQFTEFKATINYLRKTNNLTGDTFFDIGANVGVHTIYSLKEPEIKHVIAVEPSHSNLDFLKMNLQLNQMDNQVTIVPAALGETNSTGSLVKNPTNCGDYRLEPKMQSAKNLFNEDNFETETINIITLDSLLDSNLCDLDNINLMWMDTQGSEGLILGTSQKILETRCPIYVEFWPYGMDRLDSYRPLREFILKNVKSVIRFKDEQDYSYPVTSLDEIYNEFKGSGDYCDLLLIRK